MPRIKVNDITMNYEQQGSGEPLVLIPFLTADNACYAFQVAEYAKHFTCISVDLRDSGESKKPEGSYTTETLADDVSALMQILGIERAHVSGLSLGAGIGLWLAAKHPEQVRSLSVHSGWTKTDPFIKKVIESWRVLAKAYGNVPDLVVNGIFPMCFTPHFYSANQEYIGQLEAFTRSRPAQPVESFIRQSEAVLSHDVESQLNRIKAPTLITFGQHDLITSTRFAEPLQSNIQGSELTVFEASHAPIYQVVEEFNTRTLAFLQRHSELSRSSGVG